MDGVTAGGYLGFNYRIDSDRPRPRGRFQLGQCQRQRRQHRSRRHPSHLLDTSLNWDASIRARLGYVVDERALLYVTGGPSWINAEVDSNLCGSRPAIPGQNCGDESTEFGWQLGAGAEFMITDHLSMKAEYLHGWYGDADMNL